MSSFLDNILEKTITYQSLSNKITTFKGNVPLYTLEIKYNNIQEKNAILNKIEKMKNELGLKILGNFEENDKIYILTDKNQTIIEDILEEKKEIVKEAIIEGHSSPMKKAEINNLFSKETSMCKIHFNIEKNNKIEKGVGTGFFCRINHKDIPFKLGLFTNNHILNRKNIQIGKEVIFDYYKDKNNSKILEITPKRRVFTNEELDYTLIEIMDSDNLFNNNNEIERLFKIEHDIIEGKVYLYANTDIFILQFPNGNELSFSVGKIKMIDEKNIEHFASTFYGSSGSPIIRRDNYSIIGLHTGSLKDIDKEINEQECFKSNLAVTMFAIINDIISKIFQIDSKQNVSIKEKNNFIYFKKYDKLGLLRYKSKYCTSFTLVNSIKAPAKKFVNFDLNYRKSIRLNKELIELQKDFYEGIQVYRIINGKVIGALEGPPDSSYENGFFIFEIFINDYPCTGNSGKIPTFFFKTKIFHPNIGRDGLVSVNILQKGYTPALKLVHIIISIQSLLCSPNPDDFLNEEAAFLYKENIQKYEEKVKEYTKKYANFIDFENELSKYELKIEHVERADY